MQKRNHDPETLEDIAKLMRAQAVSFRAWAKKNAYHDAAASYAARGDLADAWAETFQRRAKMNRRAKKKDAEKAWRWENLLHFRDTNTSTLCGVQPGTYPNGRATSQRHFVTCADCLAEMATPPPGAVIIINKEDNMEHEVPKTLADRRREAVEDAIGAINDEAHELTDNIVDALYSATDAESKEEFMGSVESAKDAARELLKWLDALKVEPVT